MIDATLAGAPSRGVPDLWTAYARMDIWGLSELVKALCGAVGTCINLKEDQSAIVLVLHQAL